MKQDKTEALISDLYSANDNKVLGAVKMLREKGNEKAITGLVDVMVSTKDNTVYSEILQLLYDLKDKEALPALIESIRKPQTKGHRDKLIAVFWEAGLNASEHIPFFVDMALEEDFLTCFECLTVIENLEGPFDDEVIFRCSARINEALRNEKPEKAEVLKKMMQVLNGLVLGE